MQKERKISKVPLSVRFIHQRWGVVVLLSARGKAKMWGLSIFRGIYEEIMQNFAFFLQFLHKESTTFGKSAELKR